MLPKGLRYYGPVWGPSGYAEMGRNLLVGLDKLGWTLSAKHFHEWDARNVDLFTTHIPVLQKICRRSDSPSVTKSLYCSLLDQHHRQGFSWGRTNTCFTMFETDGLPSVWVEAARDYDVVVVPSEFNRNTFVSAGIPEDKVQVVPLGVNLDVYNDELEPLDLAEMEPADFTFFASAELLPRKNLSALILVFLKTFAGREDVRLIVKSYGMGSITDIISKIRSDFDVGPYPRVYSCEHLISERVLPKLHAASDAYISMSHGEGFDLTAAKFGALGKPIVVPDWSGYTEYADYDSAFLISSDEMIPANNGQGLQRYYEGQNWCNPDPNSASCAMLQVVDDPEEAARRGRNLRESIRTNFSWYDTAYKLSHVLEKAEQYRPSVSVAVPTTDPVFSVLTGSHTPNCGIYDYAERMARELECNFIHGRDKADILRLCLVQGATHLIINHEYGFWPIDQFERLIYDLKSAGICVIVVQHTYHPAQYDVNARIVMAADHIVTHSTRAFVNMKTLVSDTPSNIHYMTMPFFDEYEDLEDSVESDYGTPGFFGFNFAHKGVYEYAVAMQTFKRDNYLLSSTHDTNSPSEVDLRSVIGKNTVYVSRHLSKQEMVDNLSKIGIFILPYHDTPWWGASVALREVARFGRPIVVSKSNFFDGIPKNCVVTINSDSPTPDQILEAVAKIQNDPMAYDSVVQNMSDFAKSNSWSVFVEELKDMVA